jgi:hypothetical protein
MMSLGIAALLRIPCKSLLWRAGTVSRHDPIVGLADAIEALRSELAVAVDRGKYQRMRFRIEPIELTLQAVITTDAEGRIGWGALGIGGSYAAAQTQKLTLRLQPLWELTDGTVVEDFTVADQSVVPSRFGPRALPENAADRVRSNDAEPPKGQ